MNTWRDVDATAAICGQEQRAVAALGDDVMHPLGFLTITHNLESRGYRVRIVNLALRMMRDLQSVLPFNGWWQNPITAVFTVKGCAHECVTCGSSRQACALLSHHEQPLFRSPQNLVKNMVDLSRFSRGPISVIGDLRQAGDDYAQQVLALLRAAHIKNEIVFECFTTGSMSSS